MATVHFSSGLRRFTEGAEEIRVEAASVRELMRALEKRYPKLREALDSLAPDAEVHFLPPIGGG